MKKILEGQVVSIAMTNTIVVEVTRKTPHPLYKKLQKRSKRYKVHVPTEHTVAVGNKVKMVEIKPMSKNKYFALLEEKQGKTEKKVNKKEDKA